MDDLKNFCCQNKNCENSAVAAKEISAFGQGMAPARKQDYCIAGFVKEKFSEHRGTAFFDSRLPKEKVVAHLEHVAEGNGMRKTSRLEKTHLQTVIRYTRLAGERAEQLHEEFVDVSPSDGGSPVRREVGLRKKETKKRSSLQSVGIVVMPLVDQFVGNPKCEIASIDKSLIVFCPVSDLVRRFGFFRCRKKYQAGLRTLPVDNFHQYKTSDRNSIPATV